MKKLYVKPTMESETFVPNSYIAACKNDDGIKYYIFKCDSPAGRLYAPSWAGRFPVDDEGIVSSSYEPCNKTHTALTTDPFIDGFIDRNLNGRQDAGEAVKIWVENEGGWLNFHASKELDMGQWEVAKS